jgi:hypothetical protein
MKLFFTILHVRSLKVVVWLIRDCNQFKHNQLFLQLFAYGPDPGYDHTAFDSALPTWHYCSHLQFPNRVWYVCEGQVLFQNNLPLKIPQSHHQFYNTCTCKLWNLRDPGLLLNKSFDLYASATCDVVAFGLQLYSSRVFLRCVEMSILPWTNNIMWYVSYT